MRDAMKICLLGCGRIANSHVAGIKECEDFEIAAAVDQSPESLNAFCDKYGIERRYTSLQEALDAGGFDAVDICLPNHLHEENAVAALNAGYHVFVEKPMANDSQACQRMLDAAQKSGKRLMVNQSRRFHDAVLRSGEMVKQGEIGELISITAYLMGYLDGPPTEWWRSSSKAGGLMIPLWGNHIFDYVLWMFGECPERVYCEAFSINPAWEGEDETVIILGFKGDRYATVKMSWNTRLKPEESWDGAGKMLSSSDIIYERYIQGAAGTLKLEDETRLLKDGVEIVSGEQKPSNFALALKEFAAAIRENREPFISGQHAMNLVRVQEAALESAHTHRVVYL